MAIQIISIGKKTETWLRAGIDEYQKRLPKHLCPKFNIITANNKGSSNVEQIKHIEAQAIIKQQQISSCLVCLDEHGKQLNSDDFAVQFKLWQTQYKNIDFVIGGAYGLHSTLLQQAHFRLSLALFTFPHQFVRLILTEQLYRAWTILSKHPYHK